MNTDIPQTDSRSRDPRRFARRRRGIALIITLTVMALLLIMATSLLVNMRMERAISANFADQIQARECALAGLHTAIGHMDMFFTGATYSNALIATMPGRLYAVSLGVGSTPLYPYTNISMISFTNAFSMLPPSKVSYLGSYATRYCNLNNASYQWGKRYLPIFNPLRNPNAKPANPTEITYSEVYADFLPIIRRENNVMYDTSTLGGLTATNSMWGGYYTGRFAYWIDDESVKVNISNAQGMASWMNSTTNFVPLKTPMIYASMRSQGDVLQPGSPFVGQPVASTVDPGALDINPIGGLSGSWGSLAAEINQAQNSGSQWKPFLTPEDVLGVCNSLTMEQYQAAKFCLTTWSEDQNDFSQIFRRNYLVNGPLMTRTNVGGGNIDLPFRAGSGPKQQTLYNYIRSHLNSARLKACFAGASMLTKYPDLQQPYIGGGIDQIAANIVSYLTDQTQSAPYGAASVPNLPPAVPVGLWKAAYMNEIAFSFCWQRIGAGVGTKYRLLAAAYIETINPYEISLPRSTPAPQNYTFTGQIQFTPKVKPAAAIEELPIPLAKPLVLTLSPADALVPQTYSQPLKQNVHWQYWHVATVTPPDSKNPNTPPEIDQIEIIVPPNQYIKQRSSQPVGLVDWFDPAQDLNNKNTNFKVPNLAAILCKPAATLPVLTGAPTEANFWDITQNKSVISIAKNDPRVRAWYGPYGESSVAKTPVTIKNYGSTTGQNLIALITPSTGAGGPVDYTGGDYEVTATGGSPAPSNSNRPFPERWSNFVIAEAPMRSVGELGFIHTGKPWRSLSLQYAGSQEDEKLAVNLIPDWVLMDLLSVNTPPIHGRINVNNAGWNGEWWNSPDDNRTTSEARTLPNLYPPWLNPGRCPGGNPIPKFSGATTVGTSVGSPFGRQTSCSNPAATPLSRTLAAALSFIGENSGGAYNNTSVRNALVDAIVQRRPPQPNVWVQTSATATAACNPWRPYLTLGELCEVYRMNYYDLTKSPVLGAYTDAAREETIRRICNVLTTNSDVFAVWVVGESRGVNNTKQGEARLMAIVQRYVSVPPTATTIGQVTQRWRIRHLRWITE